MISANLSAIFYLISGVLFILALRGLSSPETSRRGNFFGILGMVIAITVTFLSIENFSTELLTVMDSLEAALAVENATVENFKNGMELTLKQLTSAFEKSNIKVINPDGEKFGPHQHQAMSTVDSDLSPNTVVHVMQKGYVLNDRIIRPALVTVSKNKDT